MTANPLNAVNALLRAQYGLILRSQALAIGGMTVGRLDGYLTRGRLEYVTRKIYRAAGGAVPPEQAHLAAVWRCGADAYLTAEAALAVWGIEGFDLSVAPVVWVPEPRRIRGAGFEVRYGRPLEPCDRTVFCGIPVVTRTRALVDLARRVRDRPFRVAFDAVRGVRGSDADRLRRRAVAALPQRGAQYVVDLVDSGVLDMESEGERRFDAVMVGVSPPLEVQVWALPDVRVDFAWLDARVVVEYDGRRFHSGAVAVEADRRRRARLRRAGWTVVVVRHEDLADPAALIARLLGLREERLRQLAAG